jgi:hypothetical protein
MNDWSAGIEAGKRRASGVNTFIKTHFIFNLIFRANALIAGFDAGAPIETGEKKCY